MESVKYQAVIQNHFAIKYMPVTCLSLQLYHVSQLWIVKHARYLLQKSKSEKGICRSFAYLKFCVSENPIFDVTYRKW